MKTRSWIILFAALALVCAGVMMMTYNTEEMEYAEIYSAGELVRTVNLAIDQEFTVHGHNTVTVSGGKIAVTWADCPDGYCMARGFCNGGTDIVCLPNRLVISFVGEQEVDAAVG